MAFKTVTGGFEVSAEDRALINAQRAITKHINDSFVQVGAVFLKTSGKIPINEEWAEFNYRDTDLQSWIDDEALALHNVGFNLQLGWMDFDIDAPDPHFNECLIAGLEFLGVDTRFRFGRRSLSVPSHVLVQLGEEEANNWDILTRFAPKEFKLKGQRYHVELRSYPTNLADKKNLARSAKQTVMPGSIYLSKAKDDDYDVSVWWSAEGQQMSIARNVRDVAQTTPRRTSFNAVLRGIAFGTFLYLIEPHWVEGSRQATANKVAGWLARIVKDGQAINNHEVLSADVFCPVDTDDIAESLIEFVCRETGDDEKHMRIRTYRDAVEKLARNSDAKIPGWPAMVSLLGAAEVAALRTVFTPGSDVSILTKLAERYLYDDTDGNYIDRDRHRKNFETFTHEGATLERRHIDETVMINGKPRAAFRMFETSKMRIRVAGRDMYPDLEPGLVLRANRQGDIVSEDYEEDDASMLFNTWRGWPIAPADPIDPEVMAKCNSLLDQLLGLLTCHNADQALWVKKWIAWTFQHPSDKQQIAWVCVGGQGVGKSFMGNIFMQAIFGALWGTTKAAIIDDKFNVGPFINKMMTFVDEVKFHNESGTDEVKRMIRSIDVPGIEKFGEGRTYKIYSRIYFASNTFDMSLGQASVTDRALFYTKAVDLKYKGMTDADFRRWCDTLKPFFDEFGAFLKRKDARQHFVRMFMDLEVTKAEVESIQLSSSQDPELTLANMRPSRRFAKYILEEGRIVEDLHITHKFTTANLAERITEASNTMHQKPVRTDLVIKEWQDAGLIATDFGSFHFQYKWGTLCQMFEGAISAPVEPHFPLIKGEDFGENDVFEKRLPWRGSKGTVATYKD